jgi:transcriptional regulator with XRE-family HTH domain
MSSLTEQNIRKELGSKIKELRNSANLTQAELSGRMGVTQTYLGHVEQGLKTPSLSFLIKASLKLKIELWELFKF